MRNLVLVFIAISVLHFDLSVSSSQFSSCETNLTWNKHGLVVAGGDNATGNHQLDEPKAIAIDSTGNLYVTDIGNKRILMYPYNSTADQVRMIYSPCLECYTLFIDQYDNLYFTDNTTVKVFNRTTANVANFTSTYAKTPTGELEYVDSPHAVYVTKNLTIYLLLGSETVLRITPGNPESRTIIIPKNVISATCMFVDEADNDAIYICDWNSRIAKFSNNGRYQKTVAGNDTDSGGELSLFILPTGILIDRVQQHIYIVDTGNNRIVRWSLKNNTKEVKLVIQFPPMITPNAMTFDKNKNLYVAYQAPFKPGGVLKFENCCNKKTSC